MYKRHCKQIVLKFYETLKIILQENPECNDMCELIFYKGKQTFWVLMIDFVQFFLLFQIN